MALGEFWKDYCLEKWNYSDTGTASSPATACGYTCPRCGAWVGMNEYHICQWGYPHSQSYWYYYPAENATKKAFRILKVLVEEKIIAEPDSYKKFCELIEKIAAKI